MPGDAHDSSMPAGTDISTAGKAATKPASSDQHPVETGDFVSAIDLDVDRGLDVGVDVGVGSSTEVGHPRTEDLPVGRTSPSEDLPEDNLGESSSADPLDPVDPVDPASPDVNPAPPAGLDPVDAGESLGVLFEGLGVLPVDSFAWLGDRALVSAIDDTAAHGFLDALRLRRIADLYTRPCLRPLAPHEFVDAQNGFTGTGSDAVGKRAPKGRGQKKTVLERGYGIRPLTRRELTAAEVVAALKISAYAADRMVQIALTLTTRLPHTFDALQRGRLDYKRVELVEKYFTPVLDDHYGQARRSGLSPKDAEQAAMATGETLEGFVYPVIWHAHPSKVHEVCAAAVIMVDPGFVERTRKDNLKDRHLSYRKDGDMGEIHARLGAAEAQGIFNVVDTYARLARSQGDERSLEVLRVDAFADLILHGHLPDGTRPAPLSRPRVVPMPDPETEDVHQTPTSSPGSDAPTDAEPSAPSASSGSTGSTGSAGSERRPWEAGSSESAASFTPTNNTSGCSGSGTCNCTCPGRGVRAHVNVVVNLETLLGLDEHPGELAGNGPITAHLTRALAFDAGSIWQRMVIDPLHGYVLDYGRTTYKAPKPLSDHVKARDRTCRTPGCTRPALNCDQDHLVPYPAGSTSESNLCTECRHHHRLKHEGRGKHRLSDDPGDPPGTVVMTTAGGQTFLSHPYDYRALRANPLPGFGADSFAAHNSMNNSATRTAADRRRMLDWLCLTDLIPDPKQPDPEPLPF